jgi:transposase
VWKEAGLKPHRIERYLASDDPDFESKAAYIIDLYLNPPQHAAVFCVDEKSDSGGRPARSGTAAFRRAAPSVTGLNATVTASCRCIRRRIRNPAKCSARPPPVSQPGVVEFLTEVVERAPGREVHIILDNLAHKSQVVRDLLASHLNVHLHFTPTYSSWLNQVEIWFSKVERDVIAREIFTSVKDLARKLRRCINAYSANAKPIQ